MLVMITNSFGCASYVSFAPSDKDAEAKRFITEINKANIYLYRNKINSDIRMPISLDGKVIAQTTPRTYLKLTVDPGLHELASEQGNFSSLTIYTKAGKNYFVLQEIISGITTTGANLQEVSEAEGRRGVRECKLIRSTL